MLIKRYVGQDHREILRRIKNELAEPCIISVNQVKPGFLGGLFAKPRWEIVAGSGFKIVRDFKGTESDPNLKKEFESIKDTVKLIERKLSGLKGADEEIIPEITKIVSEKIAKKIAQQLVNKLGYSNIKGNGSLRSSIKSVLKDLIKCRDGIEFKNSQTRVIFIGPTGVGKTTTIAKIISIYSYKYDKKVAVITNDTYRLAAVKQLERFCQLIPAPIQVCETPSEIEAARQKFKDFDLIVADTAGRSQKNMMSIVELRKIISAFEPNEVHLVISAGTDSETLNQIVTNFSPCGFNRIVLTKLDEAVKVGIILDSLAQTNAEVSFITKGQRVPQDIEIADQERITSIIVGDDRL